MSATFLLACFVWLKESTFETRKNAFYFTLKALFVQGPGTSFQVEVFVDFFLYIYNVTQTGQNSPTDYVHFPSYSVKYICFMLRHLMTPWNLSI